MILQSLILSPGPSHHSKCQILTKVFFFRVINEWNKLSVSFVEAKSVNTLPFGLHYFDSRNSRLEILFRHAT